jgi:hypothetical protein
MLASTAESTLRQNPEAVLHPDRLENFRFQMVKFTKTLREKEPGNVSYYSVKRAANVSLFQNAGSHGTGKSPTSTTVALMCIAARYKDTYIKLFLFTLIQCKNWDTVS